MEEPEPLPQTLTPCSSGRRSIGFSNSPEFEFCNSFNQPNNLLSAAELFSGGVLLPLHSLRLSDDAYPPPPPQPDPESSGSDRAGPEPEIYAAESARLSATSNSPPSSRRWSDIFRRNDRRSSRGSVDVDAEEYSAKEKDFTTFREMKKREKKNGAAAGGGATAAELNINIWPFSRSRSAGNGAARPRTAAAPPPRKVSSAPCSRSNSAGESKSRRWPTSPGRGGVHVGRSSPVWQVRRGGGRRSTDSVVKKDGNESRRKIPLPSGGGERSRTLSLSVPMCMGYRQHLSCRSEESSAGGVAAGAGGGVSGEGVRGSNLFNIKSLFTKKVY